MTSRLRTEADRSKFEQKVKNLEPWQVVLVFCHADWCAPCHRIAYFFEELAMSHMQTCIEKACRPTITFLKLREDTERPFMEQYGVSSFPSFLWFRPDKAGELIGPTREKLATVVQNLETETQNLYKTAHSSST